MKVTVFGFAGTGKTTVAKALAKDFGWEFMSNGNLFRELAAERSMALNEFEKLAEKDERIDKEVDARTRQYGNTHDNFIFEARLAWHFIPDSVKIKLACGDTERIRRIAERDGISTEEAEAQTVEREASIRLRFKEIYGIEDFSSDSNFDFVLDTTEIDIPAVIQNMKEYITTNPAFDE